MGTTSNQTVDDAGREEIFSHKKLSWRPQGVIWNDVEFLVFHMRMAKKWNEPV